MNTHNTTPTPLETRMRSICIRLEDMADAIGISVNALINKKKGKTPFTVKEMLDLSRILRLNAEETLTLFSPTALSKSDRTRLFGEVNK